MAGFVLPKLRWLVIGAVAAGGWAITQEPVSKREQRATERPAVTRNVAKPKTQAQRSPKKPQHVAQPTSAADRPQASIPEPRPSKLTTSSIKRPDKPVETRAFYTSERVRLREDATTASRFITWLEQGQKATVLESSGKWRRVVVAGRKGWVHGDYLRLPDPNAPRPPEPVAKTFAAKAKESLPASRARDPVAPASSKPLAGLLQSKRPAREAQRGDCQCPYDLMINGKQCGDRSAYVMRGRANEQCYL
jgi:hypothetical protein